MHARVLTHHALPDKIDEVARIFGQLVIPAAQQLDGFKGGYLLADRQSGKVVSVSFWLTEQDMLLSEYSGYLRRQLDRFADLTTGEPVVEHYEVSVQAYFSA